MARVEDNTTRKYTSSPQDKLHHSVTLSLSNGTVNRINITRKCDTERGEAHLFLANIEELTALYLLIGEVIEGETRAD